MPRKRSSLARRKAGRTLARSVSNAATAGVASVWPAAGIALAALKPFASQAAPFFRRKATRLVGLTGGGPEWDSVRTWVRNTAEGAALLEALMADAEDEKLWAYRALAADVAMGNHDHDRAVRLIELCRRLRQKQMLRLVYNCCLAWRPGIQTPESPYGPIDEGTITALVAAECYAPDIPQGFDANALNRDGRLFINILFPVSPVEWPVAWRRKPMAAESSRMSLKEALEQAEAEEEAERIKAEELVRDRDDG